MTKIRKIGHSGTLDPFAEGVLVLCFGKATKRVPKLMELDKEYIARVKLGVTTDTLDRTGMVTEQLPVPPLDKGAIEACVPALTGVINQIPPMFSALKYGGRRLYKIARAGQTVKREPRKVMVHTLEVIKWSPPNELVMRVVCGKGTYIRVLAADLAEKLGTVGHVTELARIRVGPYGRNESLTMKQAVEWKPIAA